MDYLATSSHCRKCIDSANLSSSTHLRSSGGSLSLIRLGLGMRMTLLLATSTSSLVSVTSNDPPHAVEFPAL